jgi:hypothetical protein
MITEQDPHLIRWAMLIWLVTTAGSAAVAQTRTTDRSEIPVIAAEEPSQNTPKPVISDGQLHLEFGREYVILPRGLQPSLFCTSSGALVVQAQMPEKSIVTKRISYPSALATIISRDGGKSWAPIPRQPGENGINLEAGAIQLQDRTILALDTYVTPGDRPDMGIGELYVSKDDWRTLQGPFDVPFKLPNVNFYASADDNGHPHAAERLHRRIIELPNGDLLTTIYGCLQGDRTPCTYQPKMMKQRVMVVRSTDRGQSWQTIGDISVSPEVGTEGLVEPAICRVSKGVHNGRLICLMRTGRNLYHAVSDDDGKSWTPATEFIFADLDVNRAELWADQFRHFKGATGKPLDENNLDELRGAVVDPDLIELRSGVLVAAFGVRIPQKFCWQHPEHPWNGNYLVFSLDHGDTWRTVVRVTSGVMTTHYMAITETTTANHLYVTYDLGAWGKPRRDVIGRSLTVTTAATDGTGVK